MWVKLCNRPSDEEELKVVALQFLILCIPRTLVTRLEFVDSRGFSLLGLHVKILCLCMFGFPSSTIFVFSIFAPSYLHT